VQFTIEPDGYIQPVEFPLSTPVHALKAAIAADMGIEPTHLVIRFFGRVAHADLTLEDCGLQEGKHIVEGNVVIDPTQTGGDYRMPAVLVVSVVNGEAENENEPGCCFPSRAPTLLGLGLLCVSHSALQMIPAMWSER
jgi:hypothetical protein